MQTFTRFYGKVAYLGTISDFSTSLRFLFYELISRFQILISVISPKAYEISPSVGPLAWETLVEALESPSLEMNDLAKKIREKLLPGDYNIMTSIKLISYVCKYSGKMKFMFQDF